MRFDPSKYMLSKLSSLNPVVTTPAAVQPRGVDPVIAEMANELEQAGARWLKRHDQFADGKADACFDMARKLEHFGSFASERQAEYARKLIEWSKPRQPAAQAPAEQPRHLPLPKLFALMQRLAKLEIGAITIARKNGDSLCWIKLHNVDGVVGKITEGGVLTIFARCPDAPNLHSSLLSIEEDPEAAAARHGKASGRCSVCSRDLTDPESIERGIGPICILKLKG